MKANTLTKFFLYVAALMLVLSYLFYSPDILPDILWPFGFLDDAIVLIAALWGVNFAVKKLKLGGKK